MADKEESTIVHYRVACPFCSYPKADASGFYPGDMVPVPPTARFQCGGCGAFFWGARIRRISDPYKLVQRMLDKALDLKTYKVIDWEGAQLEEHYNDEQIKELINVVFKHGVKDDEEN